jgi:hypothetical protein
MAFMSADPISFHNWSKQLGTEITPAIKARTGGVIFFKSISYRRPTRFEKVGSTIKGKGLCHGYRPRRSIVAYHESTIGESMLTALSSMNSEAYQEKPGPLGLHPA